MSGEPEKKEQIPPSPRKDIINGVDQNAPISFADRDPNNLQDDLRNTLVFSDIIGEPGPATYSFDKVWSLSHQVFTGSKLWCYRILTLICALPCAVWWGVCFACLSFANIWCHVPCIKGCRIKFNCIQQVWEIILKAVCAPIFDAYGRCFSNIRISNNRETQRIDDIAHLA